MSYPPGAGEPTSSSPVSNGMIECGDGLYVGVVDSVIIGYFWMPSTVQRLDRYMAICEPLAARLGGRVGSILILEEGNRKTDDTSAEHRRNVVLKLDANCVCVAWLAMASPIAVRLAKAVITGMHWAWKPKAPWKVFADDEIVSCVEYTVEHMKAAGFVVSGERLFAGIEDALQKRLEAGTHASASSASSASAASSVWSSSPAQDAPTAILRAEPAGPPTQLTPAPPSLVDGTALSQEQPSSSSSSSSLSNFGPYTLTKRLGQGGMAEVFAATKTSGNVAGFHKTVVVKRVLPHLQQQEQFTAMFLREARVAARLSHANLVQVFDAGDVDGVPFLAMEFIDGLTLHALATRAWARGIEVPLNVLCSIVVDAARALHYLHGESLVHRDISPDNVMIGAGDGTAKVLDLGIAKPVDSSSTALTATGMLKGKLPFMAPEQIEGRDVDGRADLYALGCTLYWALVHERPFAGPTDVALLSAILMTPATAPSTKRPGLPQRIDDVVARLLAKDRDARFATGREVAAALEAVVRPDRDATAAFVSALRS